MNGAVKESVPMDNGPPFPTDNLIVPVDNIKPFVLIIHRQRYIIPGDRSEKLRKWSHEPTPGFGWSWGNGSVGALTYTGRYVDESNWSGSTNTRVRIQNLILTGITQ